MAFEKQYRIKSTGKGVEHYGNCERCDKHCTEHYMQQWRHAERENRGWCTAGFGHVDCLRTGPWVDAPVVEHGSETA